MSLLIAFLPSPSWSCWMENGLKLLLYKLGEKDFENTEYKIKAVEILQIPVARGREDYYLMWSEKRIVSAIGNKLLINQYLLCVLHSHSLALTCKITGVGWLISHTPGAIILMGGSLCNVKLSSTDPRMILLQEKTHTDRSHLMREIIIIYKCFLLKYKHNQVTSFSSRKRNATFS